jgi:hypothetical protein
MLDARIYRTGLAVVALAVVVLAFSLTDQQGGLSSSLAPDAFNGQNVYTNMTHLAKAYPDRRPGSAGDDALATVVAKSFRQYGFSPVFTDAFTGRTADGSQTLENVVATRPGMESGSVVIVAGRDARGSPATSSGNPAGLSATATLIELARDLEGETLNRTVVLASTTGSQGAAGAIRLASTLSGPIDAVIVLGDLDGARTHQPIVVPWSSGTKVAPTALRNTVAAALGAQAALSAGSTGLGGQFAHLAFPFTISPQAPYGVHGQPAVLISLAGERGLAPNEPAGGEALVTSMGRAVLQTITALDAGRTIPAPSAYLLFDGKVVPGWAISLFVLALIVPVLLTTIDGAARALRRHRPVWSWLAMVLAAAAPFALGAAVVKGAGAVGWISDATPGPVPPGAVPLHGGGTVTLILAACVALGALIILRPFAARLMVREHTADGAVPGLLIVLVGVTIAIWLYNPYAALLLVPALHLWLPALNLGSRLPRLARAALLALGVVPVVLLVGYYALTLGYGPLDAVWSAALLIAGGAVTPLAVLEWSIVLGCVLTAVGLLALTARQPRAQAAPVTVRGPITYAGPGSLGGTKSALRGTKSPARR